MNLRTFIALLVALGILGGLAVMQNRKRAERLAAPGPSAETLLPSDRLNDITRFTMAVGTTTIAVAKSGDRWVVESLWNYPADFDVVADNLRKLADTKCGEVIRGGAERLQEFGLETTTSASQLPPAVMTFHDAQGATLRKIAMGSPRMPKPTGGRPSFPESAYVLLDDRDVRLVPAYMPGVPRSAEGWIDRSVLSVPAEDIDEVRVTLTNDVSYHVTRNIDGTFAVDGLQEKETVNQAGAGTLAAALADLSFNTIIDPATPAATTGLDHPSTYTARSRDGIVYTVKIGYAVPERYGRYAQVGVTYEKPAPPAAPEAPPVADAQVPPADARKVWEEQAAAHAARAESEGKRLAPWTFLLLEGDCRTMTSPRDQVVAMATNVAESAPVPAGMPAPQS